MENIGKKDYGEQRTVSPVRILRIAAALTQEELAAASGLSRQTISAVERGTALPSLRSARAIAHVLRCEVLDLFPGLLPEADG